MNIRLTLTPFIAFLAVADAAVGAEPSADAVAGLRLTNPSTIARPDEVVIIPLGTLGLRSGDVRHLVVEGAAGLLPTQIVDENGDGAGDALALLDSFDATESNEYAVRNRDVAGPEVPQRAQAEISIRKGGHWEDRTYVGGEFHNVDALELPQQHTDGSGFIRYEGPGIESDRVGYRVYLDWRNGFDIFGKKVPEMVLQDVGQDGVQSYHELADWGMDVLKVGDSVGMGGYGYWDGQKLRRVEETGQRSVRILDNGPIIAQLEIAYDGWRVAATQTDLVARLSMQAGSRLVRTRLKLSEALENVAVGIVKHPGTVLLQGDLDIPGQAWTYLGSWGRQSLADDHLGMFVLFRRQDRAEQAEDEHNYVTVLRPRDGKVEYYFGAVWEQEPNGIATEDAFRQLLEREAEKLTLSLRRSLQTEKTASEVASSRPFDLSLRLARSEMRRNGRSLSYGGFDGVSNRPAAWRYTTGLLAQALDDVARAGDYDELAAWARATIDSYLTGRGEIRTYKAGDYNIDKVNPGKMLLRLYERTGEEQYGLAAERLRKQLAGHPRTHEGAYWHKKIYPWQLWLDGVYMGMPFLAHYARLNGDEEALTEAMNEFRVVRERLRDPQTGLYYHAWDEKEQQPWADPETGLSPHFWSRGMGWYAMALVDVLDFVPESRMELREPLLATVVELADALLAHRQERGWYQVTDRPAAPGNYPEASGSAMFVYMLAKAVNEGYLGPSYRAAAIEAWHSLVREFINAEADGSVSLENICAVAGLGFGRDGSYRYYMSEPVIANDPKGTAPFIMAGLQVQRLLDF